MNYTHYNIDQDFDEDRNSFDEDRNEFNFPNSTFEYFESFDRGKG